MKTLYIPGLGEGAVLSFQKKYIALLNVFRSKQNKIVVFDSQWESDETFETKFNRLRSMYEHIHPVNIVGPSAGGSLAISLYLEHTNTKVYVICGKLRGSEKIGEAYNRRAPALIDAVKMSEQKLAVIKAGDITSYVSRTDYDGVVEKVDMFTDDMKVVTLPIVSHGRAILYWLLLYLPRV